MRKYIPLVLLMAFWSISIWNVSRFPLIQEDEIWIVSPGYKFFTQGVFGSDLFAGFYRMDQYYLEFMPLMSLLQGMVMRAVGVGVLQMRWLPVVLGTLILALTYALARKLVNPTVGWLAMVLMLFWQWTPGKHVFLPSGVPLVDLARIARYDILVPPLGLGAILVSLRARDTGRSRYDFLSGMLAGLAGLAHLYGLFWVVAVLLLRGLDPAGFSWRRMIRFTAWTLAGSVAACGEWFMGVALNWSEFQAQTAQYSDRFSVLSYSFYWNNLLEEPHRYYLGFHGQATFFRLGLWLLMIGVPVALLGLTWSAWCSRDYSALWLCGVSFLFPVCLALLIRVKTFSYLLSVTPLWAILLGWNLQRWWAGGPWVKRGLMIGGLTLLVVQGGLGIVKMQVMANHAQSPRAFFAEIRQYVPSSGRVLGSTRYWLALSERDYRSWVLPFFLSNPKFVTTPVSFEEAMRQVAPQIALVDAHVAEFQDNYAPAWAKHSRANWIAAYLQNHHARLIHELRDNYGQPFKIYQLDDALP